MKIDSIVENVTINIDGQDIEVPKGTNIIEAVKMVGKGKGCHIIVTTRSSRLRVIAACAW